MHCHRLLIAFLLVPLLRDYISAITVSHFSVTFLFANWIVRRGRATASLLLFSGCLQSSAVPPVRAVLTNPACPCTAPSLPPAGKRRWCFAASWAQAFSWWLSVPVSGSSRRFLFEWHTRVDPYLLIAMEETHYSCLGRKTKNPGLGSSVESDICVTTSGSLNTVKFLKHW